MIDVNQIRQGLKTRFLGHPLHAYGRVGSTNDIAHQMAKAGAPAGTVIVAEAQTRGRGRLGRSWSSPGGVGLYVSIILRPSLSLAQLAPFPLGCGLAIVEALRTWTPDPPQIKWPNDVVINGKKIAGILLESSSEGTGVRELVVGIGINVNHDPDLFPEALRASATSLKIAGGKPVEREPVLRDLLNELEPIYDDFCKGGLAPLLKDLRACSYTLGREVQVVLGNQTISGRAIDLAEDGALHLEDDQGQQRVIYAGEVLGGG